ncbi:uncharacterized protein LOC142166244 [Nicotiana tabacum]|uniref:Uncharacterized protein LOC142166244 n=1 Tax=Nicotiana tabacum TaxID=4097 RepID=A0AC58S7S8_TOBAC
MEKANICLKLLVDSKAHRVLFAEIGKDFVDFLFNLLKLPIGYFVGQPSIKSVFGSLGNIIPIMKNSGANYMQLNELDNVQDIMTWMITDNLFVTPSSAASAIPVLKALKPQPQVDAFEERMIDFQISDLEHEFLLVSLKSKTVLTDVFLRQTGWRKSKDGLTFASLARVIHKVNLHAWYVCQQIEWEKNPFKETSTTNCQLTTGDSEFILDEFFSLG